MTEVCQSAVYTRECTENSKVFALCDDWRREGKTRAQHVGRQFEVCSSRHEAIRILWGTWCVHGVIAYRLGQIRLDVKHSDDQSS
jgi:hypothetical protein